MIKHVCCVQDWQDRIVYPVENPASGFSKSINATVFLAFMKIQNPIFVKLVVLNVKHVESTIMIALHAKYLNIESWAIISVYVHKDITTHKIKIFVIVFSSFKTLECSPKCLECLNSLSCSACRDEDNRILS